MMPPDDATDPPSTDAAASVEVRPTPAAADEAAAAAEPPPAGRPAAKRWPPRIVADRLEDWERTVAFSIGVVTLTAALFTFLAVRQDDASSEARGQAILETLQVQRQQLVGAIRVQAEAAAADRYRRSLAEAEALESQAAAEKSAGHAGRAAELRADASALRYVADSYKETVFDAGRLSGTTSAATYDTSRRLETIQAYQAFEAIQPDQPEHTAQVADSRHEQSTRTLVAVVLLLVLVVLLTLGRILPARWRGAVLAAAVAGAVAAGVGTLVNAVG